MNQGFPVSLAMIVRDEAAVLGRCLLSAKDFVAEVVVVDTGSRDQTPVIARAAGARVIEESWKDDFSLARNRALDACMQPWILVLDADESLHFPCPPQAAALWGDALGQAAMAGYELLLHNVNPRGDKTSSVRALRLFRNVPGVRYHYPIHEEIVDVLVRHARATSQRIAKLDVEILHTGYGTTQPEKLERNARILERAAEADPGDPFLWYNLGKTWSHEFFQKRAQSLTALLRARGILDENPDLRLWSAYLPDLYHFLVVGLGREGREDEALRLSAEGLRICGRLGELSYDRGTLLLRMQRFEEAARAFRDCLESTQTVETWITAMGPGSYLAWDGLGQAMCRLGDFSEGISCFRRAIEIEPGVQASRYNLAELYSARGQSKEALSLLMEIVRRAPRERLAWEKGAAILESLGLAAHARRWLGEAARLKDDS